VKPVRNPTGPGPSPPITAPRLAGPFRPSSAVRPGRSGVRTGRPGQAKWSNSHKQSRSHPLQSPHPRTARISLAADSLPS
jgi:hypothetical protein